MRIVMNIIAVLIILVGGIWFLQGINVIGGSVMTGQSQWAFYGAISLVVGVIMLLFINRKIASPSEKSKD